MRRDGVILGEGAGLVVLEDRGHALRRGAQIYAEITGYGSSSDFNCDPRAAHDSRGKELAMGRALEDAAMDPSDIPFILANGSGILQDDIQETRAIHSVFGNSVEHLKVTGVKPVTGHLVYGSGGVETAAAVLALSQGVIPPLLNLEKRDPECDLPVVTGKPLPTEARHCLVNAFGFGGQNASLVLQK
jgi:3-oxoacyl-[acyl-carrier-protein] synthase II